MNSSFTPFSSSKTTKTLGTIFRCYREKNCSSHPDLVTAKMKTGIIQKTLIEKSMQVFSFSKDIFYIIQVIYKPNIN